MGKFAALAAAAAVFSFLPTASAKEEKIWPAVKYKTEKFQTPKFKVTTNTGTQPGKLFLGMVRAPPSLYGPFIAENNGDLIWHGPSESSAYYNFFGQTYMNKPVLTYWTGTLVESGHGYGEVTMLDQHYNTIKTICLPPQINKSVNPGDGTTRPCYADKHESLITPDNTLMMTLYNATQTDLRPVGGPKNGWVYECSFFEVDIATGKLLFQWKSLDHVPVTKSNFVNSTGPLSNRLNIGGQKLGESSAKAWDYFHINSAQKIPGGYLANSRMTWSFYKINGKSGKIDFEVNGNHQDQFTHTSDHDFFSWQHHPRLISYTPSVLGKTPLSLAQGGTYEITLFNNDNIGKVIKNTNISTGYQFTVDTVTKTISSRTFSDPSNPDPIYADAEGSVQTLGGGHTIVGYGSQPLVEEYDATGNIVYSMQFYKRTLQRSLHSYRTYRLPWVGKPLTKPKVVASQSGSKVISYMSWNGATEVSAWRVYAGPSKSKMSVVKKKIDKKGFETKHTFPKVSKKYSYIAVEALGKSGKSLGKSHATKIQ